MATGKRGRPVGIPRSPASGRAKGTPNKRTLAFQEALEKAGYDPVAAVLEIATGRMAYTAMVKGEPVDVPVPPDMVLKARLALLDKAVPTPKAIELSQGDGGEFVIRIVRD